jgi:hypothetical protein
VMTVSLISFDDAEKAMLFIRNAGGEKQVVADKMESP